MACQLGGYPNCTRDHSASACRSVVRRLRLIELSLRLTDRWISAVVDALVQRIQLGLGLLHALHRISLCVSLLLFLDSELALKLFSVH